MVIRTEGKIVIAGFSRAYRWLGRSGRLYDLFPQNFEAFSMDDEELYLLAKGNHVLWVGSSADLVRDPHSRNLFRLALDCGDRSFRIDVSRSEAERLTTIWDLEGGELLSEAVAA